jgi:hypothetical protein
MFVFGRLAGRALLWVMVIAAALACCAIAAQGPVAQSRPDTARPAPGLSPELLGPSVDEVIERLRRQGPKWACPPDVVE